MADRSTNSRVFYAQDILYQLYRSSYFLNAINRTYQAAFEASKTVKVPVLTDAIAGDSPADTTALETALTLATASIAPKDFSRGFVRRGAQWNIEDERETGGGMQLQSNLNERLGALLALDVDAKIGGVIAGATYDTVNGAGNDNKLQLGVTGNTNSFWISPSFPYDTEVKGTSAGMDMGEQIAETLLNAKALLFDKNVLDNTVVGAGAPTEALTFAAPIGITLNLLRYLKKIDGLITRDSIPGMASVEGGIASNRFFEGRWSGIDIVTQKAIGKAAASAPWTGYVIPTGSTAVTAAALPPRISDRHFDQGTTDGKAVGIRDAYVAWAAAVLRPEHVIQIEVLQK